MSVISKDALKLLRIVRENYPKTYDWMKHKANWEGMCMSAVCENYRTHIEELMKEENNNV